MNENFRKLYEQSNYSAIGFSQIIGVSRQRFYSIINNKQILRLNPKESQRTLVVGECQKKTKINQRIFKLKNYEIRT